MSWGTRKVSSPPLPPPSKPDTSCQPQYNSTAPPKRTPTTTPPVAVFSLAAGAEGAVADGAKGSTAGTLTLEEGALTPAGENGTSGARGSSAGSVCLSWGAVTDFPVVPLRPSLNDLTMLSHKLARAMGACPDSATVRRREPGEPGA